MRKVAGRECYHDLGLVDGLPEGRPLVVTAKGKPKFAVAKRRPPKMTKELAKERAVGDFNASKFNGVAFLKSLK